MLLICSSFYCLSNIALLICFGLLTYKQIRGLILIMYDQNQILDQTDKLLYCECLLVSLLVAMLTVYPVESLLFLVKLTKIAYEFTVLYVFLRLTETETAYPNNLKVLLSIMLVIVAAALYCKTYLTQKI
jgi:hypothetical protein